MSSINVTLKLNPELYEAYRSYCKKKGLFVSQQVEIMMEEKVGLQYDKYHSKKINIKDKSKEYSASLTGEPFMIHENKIVASLLLQNKSIDIIKKVVVEQNSFGYKTVKSIPKRVNSILKRIGGFDSFLLNKIVHDLSGDGKVVMLYSLYLRDRLFYEFLNELIAEKFSIRDFNFDKKIIRKFISEKSDSERKIQEFTKETKLKLVNVMFNILKESGLIVSIDKSFKLNNLLISSDLRKYFESKNENKFLKSIGASQ